MAWELLAIWAIVIATTVWFVRDERQLRLERLRDRARHFALAPAFRHEALVPVEVPVPPRQIASTPQASTAMAESRRRFLEALQR